MKIFFIVTFFLAGTGFLFTFATGVTGRSPVKKTGVDVKTIRENPGSFRSHYYPMILYSGGK